MKYKASEKWLELWRSVTVLSALDPDRVQELNSAGWNSTDSGFGHKLAETPDWSPKMAHAAWTMCRKYGKTQLVRAGIDYASIAEPVVDEPNGNDGQGVRIARLVRDGRNAGHAAFVSPYDAAQIEWHHANKVAWWDKIERYWHAPLNVATVGKVVEFIGQFYLEPTMELVEAITTLAETAEKAVEQSRAATSEFQVNGVNGTLYPFQRAGVEYMLDHAKCILGDEMGLGKTVQALAAVEHQGAYPALIVCPASLKLNWQREAQRWLPHRTIAVVNGKRNSDWQAADLVILNYDLLHRRKEIWQGREYKAVVFDEFHALKNSRSIRGKLSRDVAKGRPVCYMLSGTSILNRPSELINPLGILGMLNALGGFWGFAKRYCAAYNNGYGWDLSGAAHLDELNTRLRQIGYVRRRKIDVLTELPAKTRQVIPVAVDNRAEYDKAEADVVAWIAENEGDAEAWRASRAEQLVKIGVLMTLAAQGKLAAVVEWVGDFLDGERKLVVFAHHVAIQKALADAFPGCAVIRGEDEIAVRQANVDRFQTDPNCRLIVCSLVAGGLGITLTAASDVVIVELGWNPAQMTQAEDRVHRIGQREAVNTYWFVAEDTVDEWLAELLTAKGEVVDATLDGGKAAQESVLGAMIKRLKEKKGT